MKKAELLAPAGSFQALKGAIHAGADAVYLGGERYGARAYADNFSEDEIIQGIHLAHVFGRKIYLTVNTLVKERELDPLYEFLLPFYEQGLDGVIVQDLGALRFIREHFKGLELHASTQMAVTGYRGAGLLKEEGVSRIVPARELSLKELKEIKAHTGVEIEAFIHGAMCYCYSGQCLLSSILGGRSGNRGRCAQPCRLPYRVDGGEEGYPLSMRDMCTLGILPELLEAGIDSFKIEGRMKRPEYAAGVTAIYRKYIDLYYENAGSYLVDPKDSDRLNSLYIRSSVGEGYYHRRNGRELLTLDSPAYSETDEKLLKSIEEEHLAVKLSLPVRAAARLKAGAAAQLSLEHGKIAVTAEGEVVQKALKQPLSKEKIIRQIKKSGDSLLTMEEARIEGAEEVFLPVCALNELRRRASAMMEAELIRQNGLAYEDRRALPADTAPEKALKPSQQRQKNDGWKLHAAVLTKEQIFAAIAAKAERIYLDYSLLMTEGINALERALQTSLWTSTQTSLQTSARKGKTEFYLAAPYVSRAGEEEILCRIREALEGGFFAGVLVRNLESFAYFESCLPRRQIVLDTGIYIWNREGVRFFKGRVSELYLPVECNLGEWRELSAYEGEDAPRQSILVYGRLPMMVSAGCVVKTQGKCRKSSGIVSLKDRLGKVFPVYHDCISCYNVIYNSVPLSLHRLFADWRKPAYCRLDFTVESGSETARILEYFGRLASGKKEEPEYRQYTTGHYKRGVE